MNTMYFIQLEAIRASNMTLAEQESHKEYG